MVATILVTSFAIPTRESNDLLPVLCWIFIAVSWLLYQWLHGKDHLTGGPTSWAVLIMLVLHSLSGLVRLWSGNPRASINSVWQWIGYGLMFWLLRQLIRSARESRALCAVMIGVAGFSAIHGCYESLYSLPRDTAAYWSSEDETERRKFHEKAGLEPLPEGTPGRYHFESRLRESAPTASFALTNSLAVFLTPWLILTLGIFFKSRLNEAGPRLEQLPAGTFSSGQWRNVALTAAFAALLIGGCLSLTKSRSAYLATMFGVVLLLVVARKARNGTRLRQQTVMWMLGGCLIGAAFAVKQLDGAFWGESLKSLGYRIQYWRSTLSIIMAHPLFGCGPGNFQQYFAQFKLPQTSETVADPHNLFLEIWATAGSGTLLATGWLIWIFCRQSSGHVPQDQEAEGRDSACTVMPIYLGAMTGALLPVLLLSSGEISLLIAFVAVVFGVNTLHPWVQAGHLPPVVVRIALLAWMVCLLTSGGIGIPGVAVSGWLLLAVALPVVQPQAGLGRRRVTGALLVAAALIALFFYFTGLVPIYRAGGHMVAGIEARERAQQAMVQGRRDEAEQQWARARTALLAAAESDPYAAAPWAELTRLDWQRWKVSQQSRDYQQMCQAAQQLVRHHSRSYAVAMMVGDFHLSAYRRQYPERLENAWQAYRNAQRLYPNNAMIAARLAWIGHLQHRETKSLEQAALALKLDQLNPHMEFKLGLRRLFESIPEEELEDLPLTNAEQAMENLRKGIFSSSRD